MGQIMNSNAVVNLSNISLTFEGKASTLDSLHFQLEKGSITGLLGRNGSGKSTLMKVLLGLLQPDSGDVGCFGEAVTSLSVEARKRIGYVPQSDTPLSWMKLEEALAMIASFHNNWDHDLIKRYLTEWNLHKQDYIDEMSVGQQQMAAILMAIGHHPDLLILDEPVASLDPISRRQFLQAIVELNENLNKTILFSTHIVSDLERIASHVAILHKKKIRFHDSIDSIQESHCRLRIRGEALLDEIPSHLPDITHYRRDGNHASAMAKNWNPDKTQSLQEALKATVNAETMQLEELFMELTHG